jgi:hypothetical protein
MAASLRDIADWFQRGVDEGATHMIVVCDTYDYDDYPVYIEPKMDFWKEYGRYDGKNMQRVMKVYDLKMPWSQQIAGRVRNTPPRSQPDDPQVHAQHDETGRMWFGKRSEIPRRFHEVPCPLDDGGGMRTLPGTRQREEWRLKKIEQLMEADPSPDSDDGRFLNALMDEQVEAEKGFALDASGEAK